MTYPHIKMVLFFTRHIALEHWYNNGSIQRELAIYQKLRDYNVETTFITYGTRPDLEIAKTEIDFTVRPNSLNLKPARYERWLPYLHALTLMSADVIKTNQTNGADIALRAAKIWRKPLINRFGYMHSLFMAQMHGEQSLQAQAALKLESEVFHQADAIVCTSSRMQAVIDNRYDALPVHVVPNYVDTVRFQPMSRPKTVDVTFVGRFHEQKNLFALLEAIEALDVTCRLIGDGDQRDALQARFGTLDGRLSYYGFATHDELPQLINESRLFIMPSHYEGHPKALIEAMSCGVPVIGTDVDGIREVIAHNQNGWLCDTSASQIAAAISDVLANEDLQERLGDHARQFVLDHYHLDHIAAQEYDVIRGVLAHK